LGTQSTKGSPSLLYKVTNEAFCRYCALFRNEVGAGSQHVGVFSVMKFN